MLDSLVIVVLSHTSDKIGKKLIGPGGKMQEENNSCCEQEREYKELIDKYDIKYDNENSWFRMPTLLKVVPTTASNRSS